MPYPTPIGVHARALVAGHDAVARTNRRTVRSSKQSAGTVGHGHQPPMTPRRSGPLAALRSPARLTRLIRRRTAMARHDNPRRSL